ncbi:Non-specific serine/threonine protein kinase protein [Dioscorea alata]|uniref:Non-specific serine/threonine protein kinase protein n=1 Tax=Dioscorea alata TaxID=55571 RepID=A0ACB7UIS0_DIOAL|nr:Non-specific serine/threonine protein kinase protein [Dioscorea alata]
MLFPPFTAKLLKSSHISPFSNTPLEPQSMIHLPMASIPILLLSLNFISVLGVLDPVDFLALQAIRKSLYDLPGSRFFAAWDFTADPCAFAGVTCHNGRVSTLALGDSGAGPSRLAGHLDTLQVELNTQIIYPFKI